MKFILLAFFVSLILMWLAGWVFSMIKTAAILTVIFLIGAAIWKVKT
jgi:hypothetical protein